MMNSGNREYGTAFDRVLKALGDPHRLQIVRLLREKKLSAGDILASVNVVQSTLSHHMKALVDSGAVNAERRGKWTCYSLNTEVLKETAGFLNEIAEGTKIMTDPEQILASYSSSSSSPASVPEAEDDVEINSQPASQDAADAGSSEPKADAAASQDAADSKGEKKKAKKSKKGKKNKK